jgi:hypothetical protein
VLEDVELVEDDLGIGELGRDGVHVGAVHVGAHGFDGRVSVSTLVDGVPLALSDGVPVSVSRTL